MTNATQIRTKLTHPYSYDPIIQWQSEDKELKATNTVYSDRLFQWDANKYAELTKKHFDDSGSNWVNRDHEKIELFLKEYFDNNELKLVSVIEYCNQATGYPCWRFDYNKA